MIDLDPFGDDVDLGQLSAPQLLEHVGGAMYGGDWQSPLARDLNMNLRTLQRIAAAVAKGKDYRVVPGVLHDLHELVVDRARYLTDLAGEIERVLPPRPDVR